MKPIQKLTRIIENIVERKLNENTLTAQVQTDGGDVITINIPEMAERVVSDLSAEGKTIRHVWKYLDFATDYIKISPYKPNAVGRMEVKQMVYDYILKNKLFIKK